jgi:hypothetical protein
MSKNQCRNDTWHSVSQSVSPSLKQSSKQSIHHPGEIKTYVRLHPEPLHSHAVPIETQEWIETLISHCIKWNP